MEESALANDTILSKEDFNLVCRSCLSQGPMASIFQLNYEETTFADILNRLFCTQISHDDELPKNICETCISEVIRFYNFKKNYDTSEAILRTIISDTLHPESITCNVEIKLEDLLDFDSKSKDDCSLQSYTIESSTNSGDIQINELSSDAEEELRNDNFIVQTSDSEEIEIQELTDVEQLEDSYIVESLDNSNEYQICELNDVTEKLRRDGYVVESLDGSGEFQIHQLSNGVKRKIKETKTVKKPRIFSCSCQKVFALQSEYIKHRKEEKHPRPRTHFCTICKSNFTRSGLKQHMRRHTKEQPYECKLCCMKFSLSGNLRRHMMRHTGERPHVCEICGKGFIQAPSLTAHKRIHTGEKPFLCMYCGKRYGNKLVYNLHLQKHGEVSRKKPDKSFSGEAYQCKICHKVFSLKVVLNTHLLRHGEKKFLCSDCGKSFYTKAALQSHCKVHTGEKPYCCHHCPRTFSQHGSLKTHILTHTGDKPFVCKICAKAFTQRPHLKTHLRTHSGERPYTCSYCNKSFPHSGTLTVHIRTHTGETPYMCDMCPKGFYDSSSLKRHKKRHFDENSVLKIESY